MTVETEVNSAANHVTITIMGAFGFNLVNEFRSSYSDKIGYEFTIDFRAVDYMDSAGLGMLLNMQKYLDKKDLDIKITNSLPQVRKILMLSRFDKKFTIE